MQFLVYEPKWNPETAKPPTPELMVALGEFMKEAVQGGALVATGALARKGTHVAMSGNKFTVTDGPFIEAKDLMGGFAVIRAKSLDEAVEWTKRFRTIIGDGVSEIVPIYGPE